MLGKLKFVNKKGKNFSFFKVTGKYADISRRGEYPSTDENRRK
jgi:hypothetical protein